MMKHLICILFVALLSVNAFAQDTQDRNESRKVFCELVGSGKFMSTKVTVEVDFGQETNMWKNAYKQYIVDENGKAKSFNSMVDAMNFMANLGWGFEQAYVVTTGQQNVYHWLLSKTIFSEDELKEGITTKDDFDKSK